MGTAAYGGANEDNWKQLSSDPEQRFIILGGKVPSNATRNSQFRCGIVEQYLVRFYSYGSGVQ